jgi:hypothetical protein
VSNATARRLPPSDTPALQVRIVGPDAAGLSPSDQRRLFRHRALSRHRRDRLARSNKVVATHGAHIVGLASYERAGDELRVHEIAVDPDLCFGASDILRQLLDAVELAALAGGCRRVVLLPAAVVQVEPFERLGYRIVNERCAGAWLEKAFT